MKKTCKYCKQIYYAKPSRNKKYCSNECRLNDARISNKTCKSCDTQLVGEYAYRKQFCNHQCSSDFRYKKYIERWKKGQENGRSGVDNISNHIRRYLFEKNKDACQKCEWSETNLTTGKIPLTVNHIDGHWKNNKEENLELICPNCHSLTSTYGSLNRGNGRVHRLNKINGAIA